MSTGRMEAFSDGVFAVAITLLVLDLRVPEPKAGHSLARDLLSAASWPHYAAYVVSFLTIGIIWINHHLMVARLRRTDQAVMSLNILLLMAVVVLPFTTNLLATYLTASYGHPLAAVLYAGSLLVMAVAFAAMQHHILFSKHHLLVEGITEEHRRAIWRRNRAGLIPYAIATALAAVSAYATLAVCAAIAVFYALPFRVVSDG